VTVYIIRRLLMAVLVVLGAMTVVFFILFQTGDPTLLFASQNMTIQQVDALRHSLGFDLPWYQQWLHYLAHSVQGDFGNSLLYHQSAMHVVFERLPATLELSLLAYVLALLVALPIGIVAATQRNSIWDQFGMGFAILGQSMPSFFLGFLLLWIFSGKLGWFPVTGRGSGLFDQLHHMVLPAIALGLLSMARNARLLRSNLLEVLNQDYVRTARAKGLREQSVVVKHAVRNAIIPLVTVAGLDFGVLISGAVVIETVFAYPGVGLLLRKAIEQKDFPLVVGAVTVLATIFVALNLLVDLLYGYLDPRIHYS
jgi:peptide/nickel transport system permease protein